MQGSRILPSRNPAPLMAALIVSWGLFSILCGERLPRNGGFGWDGMYYRSIILHLGERNEDVTMYHGMRCLPCVVIHFSLKALGMPLDDTHIFQAFRVYNLFWSVVILLTLLSITDVLRIGNRGKWVLFLGLCCSFFHLKQGYYSPVLTDLWGLGLCVLALRAFFRQRRLAVAGWVLLGSFTWAIVPIFGALLILFPYRGPDPVAESPAHGPRWPIHVLAALVAALSAAFSAHLIYGERFYGVAAAHFSHRALPASLACLVVFLYLALREIPYASLLPRWCDMASRDFVGRVGLLAGFFGLLRVGQLLLEPYFSTKTLVANHSFVILKLLCTYSVAKPLVFLLAQAVYYGPVVILFVLFWRPMAHEARRHGAALVLSLAGGLFLALCTEPRFWLVFFPVFVLLLARVLDGLPLGPGRLLALLAMGVFLSKAWLPLNWAPWPPDEPFHYDDVFRFPMQAFFMNYGTWMTTRTYAIQAAVMVVATLVIKYAILPRIPVRGQGRQTDQWMPNEGVRDASLPSPARVSA